MRDKEKDIPLYILEFQENRLLYSGALGVSVVAFIELLQFSSKEISADSALLFSLVCVIVSIPVNAMSVYLTTFAIQRETNLVLRKSFVWISLCGGLLTTVGALTGLFWHFYQAAGIAFCLTAVAATVFALKERGKHS